MKQILKNKNFLKIILAFCGLVLLSFISFSIIKHLKSNVSLKLSPTPITSHYLYQNKSKGFAVYLGNRSSKQTPEVKFTVENSSIDFSPENNISDQTKLAKQDEKSVVYKNVYPGIDMIYSLIKTGVKEEIIINNQQSVINNPQFTFKLNLKNAVPQKDLMDNSITTFVDPVSGNYLFHFEKPFMIDAGGNRSDNVTLKIQRSSVSDSASFGDVNSSSFQIVIIPDNNWLKTALYPVMIDPTVVLDNADTVANWTSSNSARFTASQDTSDKQEGTGSVQVIASNATTQEVFTSSTTWTVPTGVTSVNLLVVAGGGAGGIASGGGAGGLVYNASYSVTPAANITVTVGGGGTSGNNGGNSVFDILTALGGGRSPCFWYPGANGSDGGSGGSGGISTNTTHPGGSATQPGSASGGFGYAGGYGKDVSGVWSNGGGGGGAGAVGTDAYAGGNPPGGAGKDYSSVFGTSVGVNGVFAKGGNGGDGGVNGAANTGNGGNGFVGACKSGGSGVVIVKYTTTFLNSTLTRDLGAGGTKDLSGHSSVTFWIKSTRTGTYLQFGMGESAWNDNTTSITINSANTWEQKTWDISGISDANKNAIRYLGFKVTNADTDFTMKFDDIKSPNSSPTAPTSLLTNGQTNPTNLSVGATSPYFSAIYNDSDVGDTANAYRIQVDDDSGFGSTLWDSGASGTTMNNCNKGARCSNIIYGGSSLTEATTYYWRIKFWDIEAAEGAWSTGTNTFSVNYAPTAPTSLLSEAQTNPSGVTDTTPEFSAIYNDLGIGDTANKYQIQVDDDSAFGSTLWDSGASGTAMTNCNQGNRCSDISYGGASTDLQWNTKYYWRIKYWDVAGLAGDWSTESAYFTMSDIYSSTSCMIDDSSHPGSTIVKWSDNSTVETGYQIDRSVDGGAFSLLTTQPANTTSYTDSTTSTGHIYQYRVTATSSNGNSIVCQTLQVNYGRGTFYFK